MLDIIDNLPIEEADSYLILNEKLIQVLENMTQKGIEKTVIRANNILSLVT